MGGSSVPSNTTQTTMLDPTRQAALKQAMGYFNKWAQNYNGPAYKGPLVAGRTQDWYEAQRMAHNMANRFASGGLADLRGYAKLQVEPVNSSSPDTSQANTTAQPVTVDTSSSGYVGPSATNGYVGPSATNGYVGPSATNGYVGPMQASYASVPITTTPVVDMPI